MTEDFKKYLSYEKSKTSLHIKITAVNYFGLWRDQEFTQNVINTNDRPFDIFIININKKLFEIKGDDRQTIIFDADQYAKQDKLSPNEITKCSVNYFSMLKILDYELSYR